MNHTKCNLVKKKMIEIKQEKTKQKQVALHKTCKISITNIIYQ